MEVGPILIPVEHTTLIFQLLVSVSRSTHTSFLFAKYGFNTLKIGPLSPFDSHLSSRTL